MGNYKGVRNDVFNKPDGPIELYDLDKDIKESNNIAKANPKIVNEIKKRMTASHTETENWSLTKQTKKKKNRRKKTS
jgi:hypothetical protein